MALSTSIVKLVVEGKNKEFRFATEEKGRLQGEVCGPAEVDPWIESAVGRSGEVEPASAAGNQSNSTQEQLHQRLHTAFTR